MEGYYQRVLPAPTKNPLFRNFFAGDSPESLPDVESPDHDSSEISDSESSVTGSSTTTSSSESSSRRRVGAFREGLLVELSEGERIYEVIRRRFLSCLGPIGDKTTVVSIRRKDWSGFSAQAKIQSFQIHAKAVANKHGGNPNVKFAWYGHEKEGIQSIISHGFSFRELQDNQTPAIFLSPDDSPAQSLENSIPDEDGLRHMLLCRVILGKPEVVHPGSGQTHPSSDEFDSGIDGLENPTKYITWSSNMNTHILPEYVVTFRASSCSSFPGESKMKNVMKMKMPTSPWISFPALISVLGRFLPSDAIALINKYHIEYKERRITRPELIQRVRQIAGDKLLIAVIKSCRGAKDPKTAMGFLRNRNANK